MQSVLLVNSKAKRVQTDVVMVPVHKVNDSDCVGQIETSESTQIS
jgi:hypothetical protein